MSWMTTKINVGLLDAGRIGRVHAENLAYRIPAANLAAVADVFLEAAENAPPTTKFPQ
jgi:myo-inositol 2-dehydrogenase/D-chiro-inositol 1-dehydrogenase